MELLPRIITYTLEFLPERYVQERLHQYLEIEPPRAVLQIEQVIAQTAEHLLQRIRITVIERGVRGHTRTDLVEVAMELWYLSECQIHKRLHRLVCQTD